MTIDDTIRTPLSVDSSLNETYNPELNSEAEIERALDLIGGFGRF